MRADGDYISRNAAIEAMYKDAEAHPGHTFWTSQRESLRNIPAADVRPVVRGKWEWNKNNGFCFCSECGSISPREDQDGEYCDCPNFCPNCGADMREES